jgi:hypothetical protein
MLQTTNRVYVKIGWEYFMFNNFLASCFLSLFCNQKLANLWRESIYIFPKAFIYATESKFKDELLYNTTYVLHIILYFIVGLLASSRKESFLLEEVAPLATRLETHFEMLTLRQNLRNWDKDQRSFKVWNILSLYNLCFGSVLYFHLSTFTAKC